MSDKKLCPKCVGAKIIMEPKPNRGFHYISCKLCNGEGTVSKILEDDYILSLDEDNITLDDDLYS